MIKTQEVRKIGQAIIAEVQKNDVMVYEQYRARIFNLLSEMNLLSDDHVKEISRYEGYLDWFDKISDQFSTQRSMISVPFHSMTPLSPDIYSVTIDPSIPEGYCDALRRGIDNDDLTPAEFRETAALRSFNSLLVSLRTGYVAPIGCTGGARRKLAEQAMANLFGQHELSEGPLYGCLGRFRNGTLDYEDALDKIIPYVGSVIIVPDSKVFASSTFTLGDSTNGGLLNIEGGKVYKISHPSLKDGVSQEEMIGRLILLEQNYPFFDYKLTKDGERHIIECMTNIKMVKASLMTSDPAIRLEMLLCALKERGLLATDEFIEVQMFHYPDLSEFRVAILEEFESLWHKLRELFEMCYVTQSTCTNRYDIMKILNEVEFI